MYLAITQALEKPPTFAELQALAAEHDVRINGNELAGDFCHPGPEQPKVTGHYDFQPNGDLRGDFTGQVMGKLAGRFALTTGNAEIIITERSFLLPEAILKSTLSAALRDFCARFGVAE